MNRFTTLTVTGLALVAVTACAPTAPPDEESRGGDTPAGVAGFDLTSAEIVDLTHAFDQQTPFWPAEGPSGDSAAPSDFELTELHRGTTDAGYFYAANAFCTAEHGGTHLDAPIHFGEGRWTAAQIPIDTFVGPAVVIDVAERAADDPDTRLTRQDVLDWEAEHGPIPADAIVLLDTGWAERWPDRQRWFGTETPDDPGTFHFPSYGEEGARYLIEERDVAVLGVDTASIDHGQSSDFVVHRLAAAANVPGLENVANLDAVPATGAWVAALPMKIAGGSGGPARIVAFVPATDER